MKILNLFCGIGGNRFHWDESHQVTAIDNNEEILAIYKRMFKKDICKCIDAHNFLLNYFHDFDFIWSSPPCTTHSKIKLCSAKKGASYPYYVDFTLYQEILFLQEFFKGPWVVENVIPHYQPLIQPYRIGRHLYWSNMHISRSELPGDESVPTEQIYSNSVVYGFNLSSFKLLTRKETILRNLVNPDVGEFFLNHAVQYLSCVNVPHI